MACRSVFGWQDAAYRTTDQRESHPAGAFTPRPKNNSEKIAARRQDALEVVADAADFQD